MVLKYLLAPPFLT